MSKISKILGTIVVVMFTMPIMAIPGHYVTETEQETINDTTELNDSIVSSGGTTKRYSHWKDGWTNLTAKHNQDYGEATFEVKGDGGKIKCTSHSGGGTITTVSGWTITKTPQHFSEEISEQKFIVTWNCGTDISGGSSATDEHKVTITAEATAYAGFEFEGWYEDSDCNTKSSSENPATFIFSIPYAEYGDTQHNDYENPKKPYPVNRYAYFTPIVNVTFLKLDDPTIGSYTAVSNGATIAEVSGTDVTTIVKKEVTLEIEISDDAYQFEYWYIQEEGDDGEIVQIQQSTDKQYKVLFKNDTKIGAKISAKPTGYDITFKAVEKDFNDEPIGSYTVDDNVTNVTVVSGNDHVYNTGSSYFYQPTLKATAKKGYKFTGWYFKEGAKKNFFSYEEEHTPKIEGKVTICAEFAKNDFNESDLAEFKVGTGNQERRYPANQLNDADEYAKSNGKIIVLVKDGILPPGGYTISSGNTLLIPYNDKETMVTDEKKFINMATTDKTAVSAYRTLTFVKGTNLTIYGTLYVAGQHLMNTGALARDVDGGPGRAVGPVGRIKMSDGGHIDIEEGGRLYCFGFITGQNIDEGNNTIDVGTITAKKNSTIYENFILGDMRGGKITAAMALKGKEDYPTFPFNSYFIQQIEIPITFNYGSLEKCMTSLNPNSYGGNTVDQCLVVSVIGSKDNVLFRMNTEGSTITKWYDATTDHFCFQLSGNSSMENLSINLNVIINVDINSAEFICPLPTGMRVILDNCPKLELKNRFCILPGAVLEINSNSQIDLSSELYLYDRSEWGKYSHNYYYQVYETPFTSHLSRDYNSLNDIEDAKIMVDGVLNVNANGKLYTSSSGANIYGNNGGRVVFNSSLPDDSYTYQLDGLIGNSTTGKQVTWSQSLVITTIEQTIYYTPIKAIPANLHNENGTYTKSIPNTTFYNVHGRWFAGDARNEKSDTHTYYFTYLDGIDATTQSPINSGESPSTHAVYSTDKSGVQLTWRWENVLQQNPCTDWWKGDENNTSSYYNWTLNSYWTQFNPTETEGWYSGSDNSLYHKHKEDDCTWEELDVDIDENCLYTFTEADGTEHKKALVGDKFIEIIENECDHAWHDESYNYYVCFEGCTWNSATEYPNTAVKDAYIIENNGVDEYYIYKDGAWFNAIPDGELFYTVNEKGTNDFYEYVDCTDGSKSYWRDATAKIVVYNAVKTERLMKLEDAIGVANNMTDVTIKIMSDVKGSSAPLIIKNANTTYTIDLNGHRLEHTVVGSGTEEVKMFDINAPGTTVIITDESDSKAGEFDIVVSVPNTAQNIGLNVTAGTLVINSGKLFVKNTPTTNNGKVSAIYVAANQNLIMNDGKIEVESSSDAYGIQIYGIAKINGGTINATTISTTNAIGIRMYANANVTINDVVINTIAQTTSSYCLYSDNVVKATITNGLFKATSSTTNGTSITPINNNNNANAEIKISGGYYNLNTNLLSYVIPGMNVEDLAEDNRYYPEGYRYIVTTKSGKVTWVTANKEDKTETYYYGEMPEYNDSDLDYYDDEYDYKFIGWNPEIKEFTDDITYTAKYNKLIRQYGQWLDIVDWDGTNNSITGLTLNMNGYSSTLKERETEWTIKINDVSKNKENRDSNDRTLGFTDLSVKSGEEILINSFDAEEKYENRHLYKVPYLYTANTTISDEEAEAIKEEDILYIKSGMTTIDCNLKVKDVIVCAGAELVIGKDKTLTVTGQLRLRTEGFKSAVLTNNGTLSFGDEGKMYYSRIVSTNEKALPFALPFVTDLSKTIFSNGKNAVHGAHYAIMDYDSQARANNGSGGNWNRLGSTDSDKGVTTTKACRGYQLLSSSNYYYEILFPVDYEELGNSAIVKVTAYKGKADAGSQGWNYICQPFTHTYNCSIDGDPSERIKVNIQTEDNLSYFQQYAIGDGDFNELMPAMPFYYQAKEDGEISFADNDVTFGKVKRQQTILAPATTQTQWIELRYGNNKSTDKTNIYLNSEKFTAEYEQGYDVSKLSTSGNHSLIYSSLACGDLAFAALPDDVAENGIEITVFAPDSGRMTFELLDNKYMNRIDRVYLTDRLTHNTIDLTQFNYNYTAVPGTCKGRFVITILLAEQPDFGNTTTPTGKEDIEVEQGNTPKPIKIFQDNNFYILMPDGSKITILGSQVK